MPTNRLKGGCGNVKVKVILLDEIALRVIPGDSTEDKIQQAIYTAARGRTTLIITHRLSQIRWADQIVVLRKGKIAAIGSHEELLESSLAYRRIFPEE